MRWAEKVYNYQNLIKNLPLKAWWDGLGTGDWEGRRGQQTNPADVD